jgi:hypothetical protein
LQFYHGEFIGVFHMEKIKTDQGSQVNWDKIGIFVAILTGFLMCISYIADMKERIAKLEVKVEKLEEKK